MRGGRTILGGSVEDGQSCPSSRENVPEAGILVASGFDGQDCPSSTHPAVYSPSRAITRRFVCATATAPLTLRSRCRCAEDGQSWEVQWRTDNPVRPPERTPRGRHFGGSTIRRTGLSVLHASLQVDIERRARGSKTGGAGESPAPSSSVDISGK